jgi:hypothetical protein
MTIPYSVVCHSSHQQSGNFLRRIRRQNPLYDFSSGRQWVRYRKANREYLQANIAYLEEQLNATSMA